MELFFRQYGQGKPIIILHGLFGMSDNWAGIAKKLAADYSVFLPDLRNHGLSPHSDILDYAVMADDILEFIHTHDIQHPVMIGHSMGGKVVIKLALEHNTIPEAVVIVDISPAAYDDHYEHLELISSMQSVSLADAESFSDIDRQLSQYPVSLRLRQFLLKNILRKKDKTFDWKFNIDAIRNNLGRLLEGVGNDGNAVYDGPALFIKAEHSDYIRPQDFTIIKNIFPSSEIKTIPGTSHWVHADAPALFLQVLREFFRSY